MDISFEKTNKILRLILYKFPFLITLLAGFRDCGLLSVPLLVLFHILPCELYMPPYYRWISPFSDQCGKHFLHFYYSHFISMIKIPVFHSKNNKHIWRAGFAFVALCLLNIAHYTDLLLLPCGIRFCFVYYRFSPTP